MQEERSYMSLNEKNELEKIEEKIVVKYRKYSKKTERVKKTNQMAQIKDMSNYDLKRAIVRLYKNIKEKQL